MDKICKNCKWWYEEEMIKDTSDNDKIKWVGFCQNKKVNMYIQSWNPQELPNWIKIKILTAFESVDDFGCILWELK